MRALFNPIKAFVLSTSPFTRGSQTLTTSNSQINTIMSSAVPKNMRMSPDASSMDINAAKLFPLDITGKEGQESVVAKDVTTAGEVISKHTGKYGSIAFVVRRPG